MNKLIVTPIAPIPPSQQKRDAGLAAAIAAAGGVGKLAKALGLRQPTISAWTRVPAHHVIAIETLTRLSRRVLRPDLYDIPELPETHETFTFPGKAGVPQPSAE